MHRANSLNRFFSEHTEMKKVIDTTKNILYKLLLCNIPLTALDYKLHLRVVVNDMCNQN